MKINGNFVRFGLEVDYNEAFYSVSKTVPFGDPKVCLLKIVEEAAPQWVNPRIHSDEATKVIQPILEELKETLRNYNYHAKWKMKEESWLPPTKIKIYSEITSASLILKKCNIPKSTSLYAACKANGLSKNKNTLYLPIEACDENGQPEQLEDGQALYNKWVTRLPDEIIGFPYELDATLEANYTATIEKSLNN